MARWIEDGKITDEDFAYLCGALVSGLCVGCLKAKSKGRYYRSHRIFMTTKDNSYGRYVGNVLSRLTNLNPTVKEYTYKTKFKGYAYEKPRTPMNVHVPVEKIDIFAKLMTLKENFRKLNELVLNSDRKIQGKFLQAILDAKACPFLGTEGHQWDLDMVLYVNKRQFPIINSVLKAYGIHPNYWPKEKPKFISIKIQEDVDKIIDEIGFNSERVKHKIEDLTKDLY